MSAAELTLLSWNINQWPVAGWRRRCRQDLARVERLIRGHDLVCLQECWSPRAARILRRTYPHGTRGGQRAITGLGSGLLTLSRLPILRRRFGRFQRRALPDSLAAKGFTLARVRLDDRLEINVINTHLQAWRGADLRLRQVEELARFMGSAPPAAATILAGDLNFRRESREYGLLLESLGCRDMLRERPPGRQGTAPPARRTDGGVPLITGQGGPPPGQAGCLDHLLLVPGPAAVSLLETSLVPEAGQASPCPSDHLGVRIRIRVEAAPPPGDLNSEGET